MARPIKQGLDYFSHDTHISGKTIFTLEQNFGNDGYAFWFKLLEILGEQNDLFYDCNNTANWLYLVSKMKISAEKTEEIMKLLVDLEAIDRELWEQKRVIWCQNFVNRQIPLFEKRKQKLPQKPSLRSGNPDNNELPQQKPEQNGVLSAESPQRKEKEKLEIKNARAREADKNKDYKTILQFKERIETALQRDFPLWKYHDPGTDYRKTENSMVCTLAEMFYDEYGETTTEPEKITVDIFGHLCGRAEDIFLADKPLKYLFTCWNNAIERYRKGGAK
jgi:hypothetical protein